MKRVAAFLGLGLLLSSAGLAGCAGRAPVREADLAQASWIVGGWRIDGQIRGGRETTYVLLDLYFRPDGYIDEVIAGGERRAGFNRWIPQDEWIDASWGGVSIRIRRDEGGALRAELRGQVSETYYGEECGRWGVDDNGNRICLFYQPVERSRRIPAQGEAEMSRLGG